MTVYVHDGAEFDLGGEFIDVVGVVWEWTGEWSEDGEPMLRGGEHPLDLPLSKVYHDHGPLIPRPKVRRGPSAAFLATLKAGLTESLDAYSVRTAPVVAP